MDYSTPVFRDNRGIALFNATRFFTKALVAMFLLIFIFRFDSIAGAPPSSNISGPISAVVSGHDIVLNVSVAHSTANPDFKYTLSNNTSGASIRKTDPVKFNPAANTATQKITVNPGKAIGGFTVNLVVTTADGNAKCSTSVSVSDK